MIVLGLTGSVAMGKTTTAGLFAEAGAAIYDADAAVHRLYMAGGPAGPALAASFPNAVGEDGSVRRDVLKTSLSSDPSRLATLEEIVFPLLVQGRRSFIEAARREGRSLTVLDIPLLYETGGEAFVHSVVLATTSPEIQRARVLAREGMDEQAFALLRCRQLDDAEKRRRADFVVETGHGVENAREQVKAIVSVVLAPGWRPKGGRGPDSPAA